MHGRYIGSSTTAVSLGKKHRGEKAIRSGDMTMKCPNCGAEAGGDFRFCSMCGYSYDPRAVRPQQGYMSSPPQRDDSKTILIIVIVIVALIVVPIVLGAILYFMVLGFGGTSTTTPAATYAKSTVTGGSRISILSITKTDVAWDDVRVQLNDWVEFAGWGTKTADLDGGYAITASYAAESLGTLSVTLTVTDVAGNGFVSGGDYFIVTASPVFSSATTYSAVLIYEPTGERIGAGITFTG